VVTVFSISGAIALYLAKEGEVNKRLEVEAELQETRQAKNEAEQKLNDLMQVKKQLEEDLAQKKESYEKVLAQLTELEEENKRFAANVEEKMEIITDLKSALLKKENDYKRLNSRLEKTLSEYEDIKVKLSQIRMAKEALENRIIQLSRKKKSRGVELEEIVVSREPAHKATLPRANSSPAFANVVSFPPEGSLEGQVLVVNKEFAFVVINLGQKDGLKESEILNVYRGQQFLGKVQVERIYDTMSSAVILPDVTAEEIKEGDMVKLI
jgi:chromosome segregation ATPase